MNNVTAATVAQITQEAFVPKETIGVGPGEKDPQVRLEDSLKRLEMVIKDHPQEFRRQLNFVGRMLDATGFRLHA